MYLRFRVCPEDKTERTTRNLGIKRTLQGIFSVEFFTEDTEYHMLANSQGNRRDEMLT